MKNHLENSYNVPQVFNVEDICPYFYCSVWYTHKNISEHFINEFYVNYEKTHFTLLLTEILCTSRIFA